MNINDIFLKRKKRWGTINRLRDSEEQADKSHQEENNNGKKL